MFSNDQKMGSRFFQGLAKSGAHSQPHKPCVTASNSFLGVVLLDPIAGR